MAKVLVVDDERNIRNHLVHYLRTLGFSAVAEAGGDEALRRLAREPFDLVLSDVRMEGLDGVRLVGEVRRLCPETEIVLMTAYATVSQAVEAIKCGAHDYLAKPFSLDHVRIVVERALEVQRLRRENQRLRRASDDDAALEPQSPAMQRVVATARRAAAADVAILLAGESGTGKTMLARQIHRWSTRAGGPFVTISCTTLVDHLLESELFGHVKGAFTGAWKDNPGRVLAAEGGTLFLDEVGELAPILQAKLLRFLEERAFEPVGATRTVHVDTRVIAATNQDMEAAVAAGRFRADLYFRLNVLTIRLPPLRERREDIPRLAEHLLRRLAARHRRPGLGLTAAAQLVLERYPWPGNVRELENALERAVVLAHDDRITPDVLPDRLMDPVAAGADTPAPESLEGLERAHIQRVIADSATLEEAAIRLGINVTTLWRKRKRYGLEDGDS